jgi:hypothetical protein
MTREIKFRALPTTGWKPTEGKGWIYGTNILSDRNNDNIVNLDLSKP